MAHVFLKVNDLWMLKQVFEHNINRRKNKKVKCTILTVEYEWYTEQYTFKCVHQPYFRFVRLKQTYFLNEQKKCSQRNCRKPDF